MLASFDISTSALVAQRQRLDAISSNMANMFTTRNEAGEKAPYQPRYVIFESEPVQGGSQAARGVRVSSVEIDPIEPRYKYDPGHPDAITEGDKKGYVAMPNIDMTEQFVDAIEATRSYEANVGAIEISKDLVNRTLNILA